MLKQYEQYQYNYNNDKSIWNSDYKERFVTLSWLIKR